MYFKNIPHYDYLSLFQSQAIFLMDNIHLHINWESSNYSERLKQRTKSD